MKKFYNIPLQIFLALFLSNRQCDTDISDISVTSTATQLPVSTTNWIQTARIELDRYVLYHQSRLQFGFRTNSLNSISWNGEHQEIFLSMAFGGKKILELEKLQEHED